VAYDNTDQKPSTYSKIVRAGKRRTYFFDIKESRANDYYLIITESRKRFDNNGYDKSKLFIYKEDFNKFINTLNDVVNHVKVELMPNFNFDEFNHDNYNPEVSNAEVTVNEELPIEPFTPQEKLVEPEEIKEVSTNNNINNAHETAEKW
jgi:hypothetical protein